MQSAGQTRIIRAEDVAVMGITEILRHVPHIYASYRKLVAAIKRDRPAIAILIDFPDVNFRLARVCHSLKIPVVWFVSPQLWAWKRRRLRWVQQRVSKMLVIFPFEAAFYRARNVDAEFVGHPLATLPFPTVSRADYAARHNLDPAKTWIALLPGSRQKEVQANLPEMLKAVSYLNLSEKYQCLLPIASTIDLNWLANQLSLRAWTADKFDDGILPHLAICTDAREALHHARAAIVASGTATVQALTIGNPFIVVYRVSALTFALARRLIRYPPEIPAPRDADGNLPIAMVNLIAGRRIVPELINDRFTAFTVAEALRPLLEDTPTRTTMCTDLIAARKLLLPPNACSCTTELTPIQRVAQTVLTLLAAQS